MKAILVRRWLCALIAAVLVCAMLPAALGEGQRAGYEFSCDLDGDGSLETLVLYRIHGVSRYEDVRIEVQLAVYASDGSLLGEESVYGYFEIDFDVPTIMLSLYGPGGGQIYSEGQWSLEGTETVYQLLELEEGGLSKRIYLRDPGYSDGIGLEDMFTNEEIFYAEVYEDWDAALLIPSLDDIFASSGIHFTVRNDAAVADLPEEQLLCRVNVLELPWGDSASDAPAMNGGGESSDFGVAYISGSSNLRSGPGTDYDVVDVMTEGSTAEFLGEDCMDECWVLWYHIRYDGNEGWASSKYVEIR